MPNFRDHLRLRPLQNGGILLQRSRGGGRRLPPVHLWRNAHPPSSYTFDQPGGARRDLVDLERSGDRVCDKHMRRHPLPVCCQNYSYIDCVLALIQNIFFLSRRLRNRNGQQPLLNNDNADDLAEVATGGASRDLAQVEAAAHGTAAAAVPAASHEGAEGISNANYNADAE